jgi:hypothetical protein
MERMMEKKDQYEDDAEVEYNDLKRIEKECEGWIRTSELLVKQVYERTLISIYTRL